MTEPPTIAYNLRQDEAAAIIDAMVDHLAYCHETLRDHHGTLSEAMAEFDDWPQVRVLRMLCPKTVAEMRRGVEQDIRDWFEDRL